MSKSKNSNSFKTSFINFVKKPIGKFVTSLFGTWAVLACISLFLLYGPWNGFRDFMITSAMTTINHKHIATIFFSEEAINKVMSNNSTSEIEAVTDTDSINIDKNSGNELVLTEISKDGYKAWMLEIKDPSKVILGVSKYFGTKGQKMPYLLENYNAIAGINAGGFGDANGYGNGGIPIGLVISEGEILHIPQKSYYNVVGFNKDNILVAGKYSRAELEQLNLRDAVEFTPFLVINGEQAEMTGNGGWGLAPRTAIGQRTDGTVVFVVVDGRSATSMGVTIKTLRDIMVEHGCYNAANLDGGSSTVLSYQDEIVNDPSGSDKDGMRFIPNAFIVLDE